MTKYASAKYVYGCKKLLTKFNHLAPRKVRITGQFQALENRNIYLSCNYEGGLPAPKQNIFYFQGQGIVISKVKIRIVFGLFILRLNEIICLADH